MSTRSNIIAHLSDGTWKAIYCHSDGYLGWNGKILFQHYDTQAKVEKLLSPGDLSSLDTKCSKPKGHTFDKSVKGYCRYYGRDRGERDVDGQIGATLEEVWPGADSWTEFAYVWNNQIWSYCQPTKARGEPRSTFKIADLLPLQPALVAEKLIETTAQAPTREKLAPSMRTPTSPPKRKKTLLDLARAYGKNPDFAKF